MWSCFDRGHDSTRKVFAGVDVLKKVLIVDDSVSMRQMVSFTLREGGFEVIEAEHGQDALDKLQGASVDLVITDLNMPVMDGITLIQNLRKQPAMKTKPILMLTTEGLVGKKELGKAAGATGWIVKPFDPEKLLQTVAKVLP
jgi:two-component system, chemotaxis family, chemotaxis protein CheY